MTNNEKAMAAYKALGNLFLPAELRQEVLTIPRNEGDNITEDLTMIIYGFFALYKDLTGENLDIIDFTYRLNKLIIQYITQKE